MSEETERKTITVSADTFRALDRERDDQTWDGFLASMAAERAGQPSLGDVEARLSAFEERLEELPSATASALESRLR